MLKPPSFQSIYEWRHQQEDKIVNQSAYKMNKEPVINFVQYFQRLTVWMLDDIPSKSDILIEIDSQIYEETKILTNKYYPNKKKTFIKDLNSNIRFVSIT